MPSAIRVGNKISKGSMKPLSKAICKILNSRADQETIIEALRTLSRVSDIGNITISHCNLAAPQDAKPRKGKAK